MMRTPVTLLFLLFIPFLIFSQQTDSRTFEAGLHLGTSTYLGDLVKTDHPSLKEVNFAYGAFLRYRLSPNFAGRLNLQRGNLSGDDQNFAGRGSRNYSFKAPVTELSLITDWDLLGYRPIDELGIKKATFSPYLFLGIGLAFINPEPDFNDESTVLTERDVANSKKTFFSMPIGAGVRLDLNSSIGLFLEGGLRPVFSDYLDGISQTANPDSNDWFGFMSAGFHFRFQKNGSNTGLVKSVSSNK